MTIDIQEHELFHQYMPGEGSELYKAMVAELQARARRDQAWQILKERTQELHDLLYHLNGFNGDTAIEEVPLVQARAEGLRWLIKRIELEIRELEEACEWLAPYVQFVTDPQNGSPQDVYAILLFHFVRQSVYQRRRPFPGSWRRQPLPGYQGERVEQSSSDRSEGSDQAGIELIGYSIDE
ncbi:MAG TPA: hypothetical protein VF177_05355 [Anaerolineae bacterium]